jgi:uncharacterized protein with FMN-binding domain
LPSKSKWKLGAAVLGLASIAGAFGVNAYLNPPTTSSTLTSGTGSNLPPDKTVTSDAIPYQYGTIQLAVTRTAGKIAAIDVGQSGATAGREQAFPYLVDYAIKAQSSNFANLGGATYTTDAFKQALDSAITKLG